MQIQIIIEWLSLTFTEKKHKKWTKAYTKDSAACHTQADRQTVSIRHIHRQKHAHNKFYTYCSNEKQTLDEPAADKCD